MTNVNRKIKDLKKIDEKINHLEKTLLENPDKEAYINQKLNALSNEKTLIEKFLSNINYLYIHKTIDDPYIKLKRSPAVKKDGNYISKY
jgi:septal ring factor EnvC (AmiA/AmiB activator)